MAETVIRPIRASEYPLLEHFLYEAVFVPPGRPPLPRETIFLPQIHTYIKDFGKPDDVCFVAEDDGQLVGAVWARLFAGADIKGFGTVDDRTPELALSVLPAYRGKGIGGRLLDALHSELSLRGFERVSLSVEMINPAVRLYERTGYTVFKEQGNDYLMVKALPRVSLRPLEDKDIALLQKWLQAPHVKKWLDRPEDWLDEVRQRHLKFSFVKHFIALKDGVPIGFCQYYDTHFAQQYEAWENEPLISREEGTVYSIDYLIGEPEFLGKGYGKEIVFLVSEAARAAGAKRIIADPKADNIPSQEALAANGFTVVGGHYAKELQEPWTCPKCGRPFAYRPPHHFCDSGAETIADYILGQAEDIRPRLNAVYDTIKAALPEAKEKISYRMPTFWQGRNLIHFAAFANWIGLFPGGEATGVFADRLKGFHTTKGGIRLMHKEPLPLDLIRDIAVWCGEHNRK